MMAEENPEHYGVEPPETPEPPQCEQAAPARRVGVPRSGEAKPLPLEDQPAERSAMRDDSGRPSSPKELDICPNCGASMRGAETLVCLRCGFDLKTMRVIQTATGESAIPTAEEDEELRRPLVEPGMGDLYLPGIMAGLSGLLLLIGFLAGARGLFPQLEAEIASGAHGADITIGDRLQGILQLI